MSSTLSSEITTEDLAELYPEPETEDLILGMPLWAFILVVCALVLCCCVCYFVVAWNRQMFPFSHKDPSSAKKEKHQVPNNSVASNEVQRMNSDSDGQVLNVGGNDGLRTDGSQQRMVGASQSGNLQQKLIPDRGANEDRYSQQQQPQQQSPYAQQQQQQQQMGAQYGQQPMGGMGQMGQMGAMQMDPNGLQYAMYQQQLFYQQQFMQMMMTNPQQQAILMNMDPLGRKQYIQNQMMIYMSRIAAMQQQNMVPMQQMQQQYMQSNSGMADGEGGAEGTGPDTGNFMEGGMSTNAAMNMGYMGGSQMNMSQGQYGYNPPQQQQQQVEMQSMQQQGPSTVNIVSAFMERVPVESIFSMCPVGQQDGQRRTDANRARLMVARFRGVNPMQVDEHDQAIAYFEFLTLGELKQQLAALPREIFALLLGKNRLDAKDLALAGPAGGGGGGAGPDLQGGAGAAGADVDFLVDFCDKVNLKQIFGQLEADRGKGAALDAHHARIVVANLRGATFGQVSGNDPGVALLMGKTMVQIRAYLSSLPLNDLRLLDLKAYHNRSGGGGGVGPMQGGGIVFPTINLNYNGDVRQFKVPKFGCFDEIMGFIMSSWPNLHSFKLMYQDDQASWIRITTNIDVQECIKFAVDQKAAFLSINIIG